MTSQNLRVVSWEGCHLLFSWVTLMFTWTTVEGGGYPSTPWCLSWQLVDTSHDGNHHVEEGGLLGLTVYENCQRQS